MSRWRSFFAERSVSDVGLGLILGCASGLLFYTLGLHGLASIWIGGPPFVVMGTVLGGLLAVLFGRKSRALLIGATAVLEALYLVVALSPLSLSLASGLARHDREDPADAIYVFASSIQEDGELSTHAMTRLVHGLELLAQGRAPRLVLGELPPPFRSYRTEAEKLMHNLGLAKEIIGIGPVNNTHDEAVLLAKLFRERGWSRVLSVTSPTHSARAAKTLEAQSLLVEASPSTETAFDFENLSFAEDRIEAFRDVIHERLGLFVYERRGWIKP